MFPGHVNLEIRLHPALVIASLLKTFVDLVRVRIRLIDHIGVRLGNVLLKATLLDEGLGAPRLCTRIIHGPGMLLKMIEHGILAICHLIALGTGILTGCVTGILGLRLCLCLRQRLS